jgi:hypothetical protein
LPDSTIRSHLTYAFCYQAGIYRSIEPKTCRYRDSFAPVLRGNLRLGGAYEEIVLNLKPNQVLRSDNAEVSKLARTIVGDETDRFKALASFKTGWQRISSMDWFFDAKPEGSSFTKLDTVWPDRTLLEIKTDTATANSV